jgi:hypothetical protein
MTSTSTSVLDPPPSDEVCGLDALVALSSWSDQDVARLDVPVIDVPLVTVGGGLGSLALVDSLRVAGLSAEAPTAGPARCGCLGLTRHCRGPISWWRCGVGTFGWPTSARATAPGSRLREKRGSDYRSATR